MEQHTTPKTGICKYRIQKRLGWILHSIAFILLLWATLDLFFNIRAYGFDYGIMQDALFPAVSFLVLSVLGTVVLRSFLALGYSFCIASGCLFLGIFSGFVGVKSDLPLNLYLDALPLVIIQILLNILGVVFLRLANYKRWKWWLKAFLPCTLITLLLASLAHFQYFIFIIIIAWIWYIAAILIDIGISKRDLKLKNYLKLAFSAAFIFNLFVALKHYIDLQRMKGFLDNYIITISGEKSMTIPIDIPPALMLDLRWSMISIILSILSLIILFHLIKKTKQNGVIT